MTTKPWCSICGKILDDVDSWSKDRPTEPGWYWVLWSLDKRFTTIEWLQGKDDDYVNMEYCQFAPVLPHPPLPKEVE